MRIYLDDERQTPEGFDKRVYTASEAIDAIERAAENCGGVDLLSLDHDLGNDDDGTGYTVITWIEEQAHNGDWHKVPRAFNVHSANPVGANRMWQVITNIGRMRNPY